MYTAYVLTDISRKRLLNRFPPKYSKVIAHHVTVKFGVPKDTPTPQPAEVDVVGYTDSEDGIEAVVVTVSGKIKRSDGKLYHITLSLNPDIYKPVDANALVANGNFKIISPFKVDTKPVVLN